MEIERSAIEQANEAPQGPVAPADNEVSEPVPSTSSASYEIEPVASTSAARNNVGLSALY